MRAGLADFSSQTLTLSFLKISLRMCFFERVMEKDLTSAGCSPSDRSSRAGLSRVPRHIWVSRVGDGDSSTCACPAALAWVWVTSGVAET